jgi:hypothetical protein
MWRKGMMRREVFRAGARKTGGDLLETVRYSGAETGNLQLRDFTMLRRYGHDVAN